MSAIVGSINAASVIYDLMTATINFTKGWIFIGAKNTAKKIAVRELSLAAGDRIVITGGDTTGSSGNTNLIKIEEV